MFWMKLKELFTSRKFQLAASASITAVTSGIMAGQSWPNLVMGGLAPMLIWILAQAHVDAAKVAAGAGVVKDGAAAVENAALSEAEAKALVEAKFAEIAKALTAVKK